jgi:Capsule polysaccharide biosynthesis protein
MKQTPKPSSCFLISTLAEYQSSFWLLVGRELEHRGQHCEFLSFDDRSTETLRGAGFKVHAYSEQAAVSDEMALLRDFDVGSLEALFLHERLAFNEQRHQRLRAKLCRSISLADRVIADRQKCFDSIALIQEVGGFLSVIGCQLAAQRRRVPNWFIEPAFFKGRLFFTRDTFAAPKVPDVPAKDHLRLQVLEYVASARQQQTIVIPEKDRHHYNSAVIKVVNKRNVIRLVEKVRNKYLLGKYQEFGYVGHHVATHLRMLRNSIRLKFRYTPLEQLGAFVYFPLHVPVDMALTLRSPEYLDQLTLIEQLLRATPVGFDVAVKEHPAMIGACDGRRLIEMSQRYPQLKILPPTTNNYEIIKSSRLVVSINSKSGMEALLLGKPIIVLGDAFYTSCRLVRRAENYLSLREAITTLLRSYQAPQEEVLIDYLCQVWAASAAGELYVTDAGKIREFCESLIERTSSTKNIHISSGCHYA